MAIKTKGSSPFNPLAFSEIEAEFGANPSRSLGAYRQSQTVNGLTFNGIDSGIQHLTGNNDAISFEEFYGKKLNVVVDLYSTDNTPDAAGNPIFPNPAYRTNAKARYNANNVVVIGGHRSKKQNGSKITIRINKKFGSSKNSVNHCAVRTGTWGSNADTEVIVDLGSSARVFGAGGNGGTGATGIQSNANDGQDGSSGLGIQFNGAVVNFRSGAQIRRGYAGGGGGGGGRETSKTDRRASGGGGGGGAGLPPGNGGPGGAVRPHDNDSGGDPGGNANETARGMGGNGGDNDDQAGGGKGGNGGQNGNNATAGANSNADGEDPNNPFPRFRGVAGSNGAAIRKASGVSWSFGINNGTTQGSTNANTVA